MRVAYFNIGFALEDWAINNAKKYGGDVVGRYLKQLDGFKVFAPESFYENLTFEDRKENCYILSDEVCKVLQQGYPIDQIFNFSNFDIILHPHTCFSFNRTNKLKLPMVHWSGFSGTAGHSLNDYILLYRKSFTPCFGEKAKYFVLGKAIPEEFQEHKKSNYIFQCTQNCKDFNTIEVAKNCIKYGINGFFGGPIRDYDLMDYINNKNTFYLGIMSEQEKLKYTKEARLYTNLSIWDVVYNQSVIESWGLGTPVLTNRVGWFNEVIRENVNGFFYDGSNFKECYDKCLDIKQIDCYNAAKQYDVPNMINSFKKAFNEIKQEWNYNG